MSSPDTVPTAEDVEDINTLHGDVVEPLGIELDGGTAEARVKRGGVRDYERRTVRVSGDGFTTYVPAAKLDLVIASLLELRCSMNHEEFRVPNCVYCGEEHDSVEDAREHFESRHEGNDRGAIPPEFDPDWYDSDPRGEMA